MPATLEVVGRGPITTYDSACKEEFNVLSRLAHAPAVRALRDDLWRQRESIEALTRQHLGLGKHDTCRVLEPHQWIRGGFNICVLVEVGSGSRSTKVVFRCAMPHKLAEAKYPGTVDEKVGSEVGAYVWMQEKCSNVRIPHLYGFGFADGRHFTHARHKPLFFRLTHMFRRYIYGLLSRFLNCPVLSQYTRTVTQHTIHSAYMLLEYIGPETGQVLSATWDKHRGCYDRRQRLFSGLSQIMLSLASLPLPRIGAFQFNADGTITLSNRPLFCSIALLENDGAPRTMKPNDTYGCTDAFVSDLLTFHDQRFLNQPNAIFSENDCRNQMTVKTLLRVFAHRHIRHEHRQGPFLLQLTDLHTSNIFVDDDWNVTCLIDLEWLCALPAEMLSVPYWLTGCSIDEIQEERYDEYNKIRQEFMHVFQEQERMTSTQHGIAISDAMHDMWDSKGVWFWHCLKSINAMYFLLESHLCSEDSLSTKADKVLSRFWCEDSEAVVQRKLTDRKDYDAELKRVFE